MSPGWLLRHAIVLVLVAIFLGLGWWQLGRAEQGNALSFGYTLEWPFFAAFVIFMWIREMRMTLRADAAARDVANESEPDASTASKPRGIGGPDAAPHATNGRDAATPLEEQIPGVTAFDATAALAHRAGQQRAGAGVDESSEYNRYLAWLAAHPEASPRDYRQPSNANEENIHG